MQFVPLFSFKMHIKTSLFLLRIFWKMRVRYNAGHYAKIIDIRIIQSCIFYTLILIADWHEREMPLLWLQRRIWWAAVSFVSDALLIALQIISFDAREGVHFCYYDIYFRLIRKRWEFALFLLSAAHWQWIDIDTNYIEHVIASHIPLHSDDLYTPISHAYFYMQHD